MDFFPNNPIPTCDPDAEKYLNVSIDNLAAIFGERLRLGLLSKAIKQKDFLSKPATPDDIVFSTLDSVAYHIKAVDDEPEYHDEYLALFKSVNKYSKAEWCEKLEEINDEVEKAVTRDKEPNDLSVAARNRHKESIGKFRREKKAYLEDLENRRWDLGLHLGPRDGLSLTFLGGRFAGSVLGGFNTDASVPTGTINAFAGPIAVEGSTGPINSHLSSGVPSYSNR